ncbi:hypothetical protein A9Q74_10280 [Colwellia sp. 39_35_sub15_T18]|nr:hypothetical protein A9Q74_10280 [Colwellia sp. 39_35_sub15_T18]
MIVIRIRLKVDQENKHALLTHLKTEVQKNKTLSGCLTYSLYQDVSESNTYLLYEEWDNLESFNLYKNSAEFQKIMIALSPLLAGPPDSVYYDSEIVGP